VSRCHSALTQKKGTLTPEEIAALRAHGSAWGCDLCQLACPVTKKARENGTLYTAIPFFTESAHTPLTAKEIEEMPDEEFAARAYSWRGKPTVLRNLKYLEEEDA
jgi:epoxyqueuosine reductase QueG